MSSTSVGAGNVSIVIPCYNQGALLREALASVEQVRNENLLEVIVVDNGSSEVETTTILRQVQEAGYCVVPQPNCGLGAARNAGIRRAKGEFVLPLGSDNRLRDAYLNEGLSLLKNNTRLGVVYADAEYFGERTGLWHVQEFNLLSMIRGNFIDACALFRKKLWEEVGGYDEQMPWTGWEEWDFWLRVAYRQGTFVHLPKVGFDHRVGSESVRPLADENRLDLLNYVFGKPEMTCYRLIREMDEQAQILRTRIKSMEDLVRDVKGLRSYRLGRALLAPARLLRKLWRCFH
ncbi:MAG TPA: glycosyltransferase [Candidatus Udaeobacter sp.]|jgi:glycosyltransferase involved in cell wall biosynthesis